jgi:alpha-D-xyloside xylohydrolase
MIVDKFVEHGGAARVEWRIGTYEMARPIFDRRRRRFHPIEELTAVRVEPEAVHLSLRSRGGKPLKGRVTFADPQTLRLQWSQAGEPDEHITEMLVAPAPCLPLRVEESANHVRISAGGTAVVLTRNPWHVEFGPWRGERGDTTLIEHVNEPGGWAEEDDPADRVLTYETFALQPGEQLWGLGERFLGPNLAGRRLAHMNTEPGGANTTDRVYKSVPMVVSSSGYGLFVHHGERAVFDLGATSTASASVLVDAHHLDLFVMLGDPKQVLRSYTALTGRAPVPPEWSFGVWMSKCMYGNRAEVEGMLDTAAALDIPVDVVGLDPMWLANRPGRAYDFCDFVWNEKDFGPMREFVDWVHGRGAKLCLWVNPNVVEDEVGWVPDRLVDNGRARELQFPVRGFVDFTGKGADWWIAEMRRLLDAGVDAFKLDYGELAPIEARYADGRSGREVHNLYGLLASITAHRAGAPFTYTRSGTAGSQRHPVHWPGDTQSTWAGMHGSLRGALSAAWSGFAFWANDIGGFFARDFDRAGDELGGMHRPEPELFIRWTQYGLLCSHCRFHGILGREPWLFGDDAVRVARDFITLRKRLTPYLLEAARQAADSGVPVLRPVAMEFPEDRGARNVDTEYLLGPSLLVAPVLQPGGRADVYIPPGGWTDHFTGERHQGPGWVAHRDLPLDRLPLLVRDGDPDPLAAS